MAIEIGSSIGAYEITSLLGKGGMGEVYRARDTKLKRDVAIKTLPSEFERDLDRLARFQREAEALAALNHQNIGAVYDLQEFENTRFLVLELVDGETLSEIITQHGPLPLDEALKDAQQICEALEAAHEKGIVHRDLKPANIKRTPDGRVKVLDFGLAKAVETKSNVSLSNSPTLSLPATNAGVILGTAAYMSPEQARGRAVDKRTDIFAFGCVLFEMLTGKRAFDGEDTSDVLSAILRAEPNWNLLPTATPSRVREMLKLCIEKDPKKRRRDAGDVLIDIEQCFKAPMEAATVLPKRSSRLAWVIAGMMGIAAVFLAVLAFRNLGEMAMPEIHAEISTPATTQPLHFAISPDGKQIVFVASGDSAQRLWVRSLNSATSRPLAGTDGGEFPFWSADNRSIGFFAGGKLKRMDLEGVTPQLLADAPAGRGGTWSDDGTILFAQSAVGPLFRVPAAGGKPIQVTSVDSRVGSHRLPQFLPDGQHFLFFVVGSQDVKGIYLGSLSNMQTTRLITSESAGAYIDPGWLIFNNQGALVARRLNVSSAALEGETVTLAESVGFDSGYNLSGFSVSANRAIAYRTGYSEVRQLTWFDRAGRLLNTVGLPESDLLIGAQLSPDGQRAAVTRITQGNQDIWTVDLSHGSPSRLTFDPSVDGSPIWSPDGRQIAFNTNHKGVFDLYVKPSSGNGTEQPLFESSHTKIVTDWSSDGRHLLYADIDLSSGYDLWALPLSDNSGSRKPIVVANTPFEEREGQFSPDSHWIAYRSNESGQFEIYVQAFPNATGKWRISTAGGISPRWRRDGNELFFVSLDGKLMSVSVQVSDSKFEFGTPTVLFQTHAATGGQASLYQEYDISKDGKFLINTVTDAATTPISLILNWRLKQ